jgi:hypothetical protein
VGFAVGVLESKDICQADLGIDIGNKHKNPSNGDDTDTVSPTRAPSIPIIIDDLDGVELDDDLVELDDDEPEVDEDEPDVDEEDDDNDYVAPTLSPTILDAPTATPHHHKFDLSTDQPTDVSGEAGENNVQSLVDTPSNDTATKGSHMYTVVSVLIAMIGAFMLYKQCIKRRQRKGQPKTEQNLRHFHDEFEDQLDEQGGGFRDVELDSDSDEDDDEVFILDAETLHRMN